MDAGSMQEMGSLTTAVLADACLREGVELRTAPPGLRPVLPGTKVAGPVLPARHSGSVDVFFEAIETAGGGEVLVIDNEGRTDEACIGDLVVIEAREAGLAGILVWGLHRDSAELKPLGLPVFSYGQTPLGPRELRSAAPDALDVARFGEVEVTRDDFVLADSDGAIFAPLARAVEFLEAGRTIMERERVQAERAAAGTSLREQMRFGEYLVRRAADPSYTFREHLRGLGAEIEE